MSTGVGGPADGETAWLERYRGLSLEQALRLARIEERPVRVVGPVESMTTDWKPERLTVRVGSDGAVIEVRAG